MIEDLSVTNLVVIPSSHSPDRQRLKELIEPTLHTLQSEHSRRVYKAKLVKFIRSNCELTRNGVGEYLARMTRKKASVAGINQTMAVIRKLVIEAEHAGLVTDREARAIRNLKRPKSQGVRFGRWMTQEGARRLVKLPDRATVEGKRDACLIALLLGCGLRREEASNLTWEHYQSREGRMCLVDIEGKGRKLRTIPVSNWAKQDIDAWKAEIDRLDANRGPEFVRLHVLYSIGRGKRVAECKTLGGKLSAMGVWWIVKKLAEGLGIEIAPHDLRRSLAQLMRRNGAELEQIQYVLGHQNIQTTMRYLGGAIELVEGKAAVDLVKLGEEN